VSGCIKLNVINQTADLAALNVVICQHNANAGMRANPVAWRVLRNIGAQESRPFEVPQELEVLALDPKGNATARMFARDAQAFALSDAGDGPVLTRVKSSDSGGQGVEVCNLLATGPAEVRVLKSDRLLATKSGTAQGEAAAFLFHPHLYIGLAAQIEEGALLSHAVASRITTRINLFGIKSGDIVITSGKNGPHCPVFRLENIQ